MIMLLLPIMLFMDATYVPDYIAQLTENKMDKQIIGLIVLNNLKKILDRVKECKTFLIMSNEYNKANTGLDPKMTKDKKKKIKFCSEVLKDVIAFVESCLSCAILIQLYIYLPDPQTLALAVVSGIAAIWRLVSRFAIYCKRYRKYKAEGLLKAMLQHYATP